MREHDVAALTAVELEAARRELAASLALARPGSPVRSRPVWPPSTPNWPGGQPPGPAYPAPRAPGPRTAGTRVEEGRRGTQLTHGFHTPKELEYLKANVRPEEPESMGAVHRPAPPSAHLETSLAEAREEIVALRTEVNGLRETLQMVQEQVTKLTEALGA